jgi:hypothetical protein
MSSYVYNSIQRATTSPVTTQANWSTFTTGLGTTGSSDGGSSYYFVTPIITPPATADPSGQVYFTYGNGGTGPNSKKIFLSNATGWTTIGTAGSNGFTAGRFVRSVSHGLGVSPVDLQHIAAAENGGYVLLTSNGGTSWTEVFLGSTGTDGQNIGWVGFNANVAWANNSLLYICSEAQPAGVTRVAKSANGGATWSAAATGLPDVPVTKLAVDPGDAMGNTVYAATWLGVYRTTDGGGNWSLFGTGLPQGRATDLWVAPDSSSLRVATWGRGVWEIQGTTPLPTVTISPSSVTMINGGTQSFTPSVSNGTANTVIWSATTGTTAAGPTATGVAHAYTAPPSGNSDTVTVTTVDTPVATAQAAITLVAPASVTVTVSPTAADIMIGAGTQQFTATVSPLTNSQVTWSGTGVNTSGLFSATGLAANTYIVTATSQAAPTRSGTATVKLLAPSGITVSVSPTSKALAVGGTQTFAATVTGPSQLANQTVTWSTNGGTITAGGLFTATTAGSFTVTATNTFSGLTGTATVNILTLDLNGDGSISPLDLLTFAKYFGTTNASCLFSGDSTVSDADLAILLAGL